MMYFCLQFKIQDEPNEVRAVQEKSSEGWRDAS